MKFKNLPKRVKVSAISAHPVHQTPITSFYKELERKEERMRVFMEKEFRV